ncbi:tRNA/rRNA methyltransferase [Nafulsella turpanensis]|uniref:tRNA/rRNA methyltransferase n=1 Tax=Nafulsella turpanensis TaxID=1265690 RepID=UPI0003456E14|nr:tRNA/rRNA methyltransferase [Nafulsella turpanensis]
MQIHFILVEPAVPENVGASARAMNTMGFQSLRLVNPCDHLSTKARMLAHGSNHILESAKVYTNLEEAASGMDLLIGTTANQQRTTKQDYHSSTELATILQRKAGGLQHVGLVFGREESGLTNEELLLCDMATSIPLAAPYPSVNLGQAVMIFAYALSQLQSSDSNEKAASTTDEASYGALKQKVERLLTLTEIDQNPTKANRLLERMALIGQTDLNLLHTLSSALLEKLEKPRQ